MKAAQITEYGGKDALKTVDDAPKPSITADQVLVEVHAAAVNPFDWKVREGYLKEMIPLNFPATLGGDVSGVIAEIGEDVSGFAVGDEVYGQANAVSGNGSYAEFTPVKAFSISAKPKSVDFVTAAALPLASVSAYQALVDHIGLKEGQKILIQGGAGGIGSLAIQIAKHLGAEVAATAATDDVDFVKGLGADTVIDYRVQDFTELLKDYDAVFDTVGGDSYTKSYSVLKDGGIIVAMSAQPNEELAKEHNITAITQQTQVNPERLAKITELVDDGILKVNVGKVFTLDEAAEALAYIQEGKHQGKVVLKVKD